jgi:hypothetical protein
LVEIRRVAEAGAAELRRVAEADAAQLRTAALRELEAAEAARAAAQERLAQAELELRTAIELERASSTQASGAVGSMSAGMGVGRSVVDSEIPGVEGVPIGVDPQSRE